jgi:hypothetical protein
MTRVALCSVKRTGTNANCSASGLLAVVRE